MDTQQCSLKVLLVEDSRDFVYLISSLFESMGHTCISAYDGFEGVCKAQETKPDVIFCDIGLPGMDGFEVAKKIRENDAEVPIVALSGYTRQSDLEYAIESGFNFHIAKPAGMAEIKKILDNIRTRVICYNDTLRAVCKE